MTDQERAENARILLSHATIKSEFRQNTGSTIFDLIDRVESVQPSPVSVFQNKTESDATQQPACGLIPQFGSKTEEER